MNIFSLAVELTQGGVKIDFGNKSEEIVLPTSENDPYGIIGKCEEMDITAETPHYLPEGFMLVCMESDKNDYMDYILLKLLFQYFLVYLNMNLKFCNKFVHQLHIQQ